ncbi:thioredoxin domain-containing protein [Neptuniibacter sp. PT34_22]|uniref:thioredoxin family protein n=1 Tax=Neptuniibacter sp. PT34_22 TaxID=3398205 RepID=UPI0039F61690
MKKVLFSLIFFYAASVSANDTELFYFEAEWCGPCKRVAPVLQAHNKENPQTQVKFVDVDNSPEIAEQHKVRGIPVLHIYTAGKHCEVVGAPDLVNKPVQQLIKECLK